MESIDPESVHPSNPGFGPDPAKFTTATSAQSTSRSSSSGYGNSLWDQPHNSSTSCTRLSSISDSAVAVADLGGESCCPSWPASSATVAKDDAHDSGSWNPNLVSPELVVLSKAAVSKHTSQSQRHGCQLQKPEDFEGSQGFGEPLQVPPVDPAPARQQIACKQSSQPLPPNPELRTRSGQVARKPLRWLERAGFW